MVAQELVIRLAVIVGDCNVLCETVEQGTEHARRLFLIRDIVESAVKELQSAPAEKWKRRGEKRDKAQG